MRYALCVLPLLIASAAYAGDGARNQDPDVQLSDSLSTMESNGHLQCLMRIVKNYYDEHTSTINILERCGVSEPNEIRAAIRTVIGVRDIDWRDHYCGPLGSFGQKCYYKGIEIIF
jgi:hypothetical protein